jgi:hypothetical protein
MRVEKRNGYRVVVGGPVPPQAEAITLGNTIFVRTRSCDRQGLLAHELVHVRQFKDLGPVRFLARYVGAYLRFRLSGHGHTAAYRRIPLEVEASWVSRLHPVHELEPGGHRNDGPRLKAQATRAPVTRAAATSAVLLRDRLGRRQAGRAASARPVLSGGAWNRPRPPSNLKAVQAAMARRDANDSTSR